MSQAPGRLTTDLKPDLEEIPRLAGEVESFLGRHGVPERTIMQVNIVLEELITNVISYGIPKSRDVHIRLEMDVDASRIEFSILDNGRSFNPLRIGDPDTSSDLEERRVGGLGVHLARQFTDSQAYERRDRLNVLRLVKRLE